MRSIIKILLLLILDFFISLNIAQAGSITTNNKATATLISTCSITGINVDFGNLTATNTPTTLWATGGVQALCSKNANYSIQLSLGNNVDPNNWRRMIGASNGAMIQYTLCQTQSSSGTFGTASGGCTVAWRGTQYPKNATGTGSIQSFPVYGWSSTGFYTPDTYSDTITATITY